VSVLIGGTASDRSFVAPAVFAAGVLLMPPLFLRHYAAVTENPE
jgi:hypothetical protein